MPQNLKPLTSLRFFAAMWVVLFDYWPKLVAGPLPAGVAHGYLGVELFFVLSGFILCHVYLDGYGEGRFRYGSFLWARLARVYPLHLATLLAIGVLGAGAAMIGARISDNVLDWRALAPNLLLVHAWGLAPEAAWNHPSWSISAEWFAYLCFPVVAWAAWRLRNRPFVAILATAIIILAVYPLFRAIAGFSLANATIAWGALRIVPCFLWGAAIYLLWRSGLIRSAFAAKGTVLASLAAVAACALLSAPEAPFVLAFGGLILGMASLSSTGSRLFGSRIGVYLGEVSYAIYMVCIPWMLLFVNGAQKALGLGDGPLPWPLWSILFLGVIPVAMVAHHAVERPCREAMRRWQQGWGAWRSRRTAEAVS